MNVAATRQRPATDTTSWRLAMQRNGTPDERFWAKVEKTDTCWLWTGSKSLGYGQITIHGKAWRAHRYAYETLVGPVPEGLQLDHVCRVRNCVNPDHLEPVTTQENTLRGEAGINQRVKTHCPSGHPYDGENTLHYRGFRYCRTCIFIRNARRTAAGRLRLEGKR